MKSVFDTSTRNELIERIRALNADSKAQWGKMNVLQMVKHGVLCEQLYLGKIKVKRAFLGRIFGKIGLKNLLKENKPFQKNAPTAPAFVVTDTGGDLETEKGKWISLMHEY